MEIMRTFTNNEYDNSECPICNENINESFTTSCCKQIIHKECMDKCLQSTKGACPYCRKLQNVMEIITETPELDNDNNINQVRFITFQCTPCKIFLCNILILIGFIAWSLTYQITANKKLLRGYQNCYNYSRCNVSDNVFG